MPKVSAASIATATEHHIDSHHDHDQALLDSDDEDELDRYRNVKLREGFRSDSFSGSSDDEEEEETADVIVAREIEKRGGKEG